MSQIQSTSAGIVNQYQIYFSKQLLAYPINVLKLAQFGSKPMDMPRNLGTKSVSWFRFGAADDTQVQKLTEGSPINTFRNLQLTQITQTLQQLGEALELSDILDMTQLYDAGKQAVKTLGEDAVLKYDSFIRNNLVTSDDTGTSGTTSGITERFAQGLTSFSALNTATAQAAYLDAQDVLDACTRLKVNKTPPLRGSLDKMNGGYVLVVPPQVQRDLLRDSDFLEASKYSDADNLWNGEIGSLYGIRIVVGTNPFIESSTQYVFNSAGSIFSNLLLGQDCYGVVPIAGSSPSAPKVYINNSADKSDPLNQMTIFGWKAFYGAKLLNANFCVNLRSKSRFA